MKLSVIIINYNVKHYLAQCLNSVQTAIAGLNAEVIVVDNHSHDGSLDYLRGSYPWVRFVASNHNLGFARANNIAIRQAKGEYILLLNPDTVVGENTIKTVISFMDKTPDSGGCGVEMLQDTGQAARESRRGLPSPMVAFYKMMGLCAAFPHSRCFGHYYMGWLPWDKAARIEVISGAFCMLRHAALDKTGLLDEDFFMYGEDIDLSYRVLKAGYTNWYVPARILHYKGESTQKSSFRYVHVFYDAMLIFFRKHYSHLSGLLSLPIKMAIYAKATAALTTMTANRVRKALGFFSPNTSQQTEYHFYGHHNSLQECRRIADDNALKATFHEIGDEKEKPNHLSEEHQWPNGHLSVVVYDTSAYTYQEVLDIFASQPQPHVAMGFYHPLKNFIVTPNDIFS